MRRLFLLLLAGALVYWLIREHASVSGFIDRLTSPLLESKAAVGESEHNRIVSDAAPVTDEQNVRLGTLKEGMSASEIRQLLGSPASQTDFMEEGQRRVRWTYPKIHRVLVLQENRVVSVAIQ